MTSFEKWLESEGHELDDHSGLDVVVALVSLYEQHLRIKHYDELAGYIGDNISGIADYASCTEQVMKDIDEKNHECVWKRTL